MPNLPKDDKSFIFIEKLVIAALKAHIAIQEEWLIEKEYFEETWTASSLDPEVAQKYCLQISDLEVETEFADDEDPESLTNCYVTLEATGALRQTLAKYEIDHLIEVDFFNDSIGSAVILLTPEDVDNSASLLKVPCKGTNSASGLIADLRAEFEHLI